MAFCSSCGSQLSDAARFCSDCGSPRIENAAPQREPEPLGQERILYRDEFGSLVSTTRAVLAGVTYPIASISSVRMVTLGMSCWGPALMLFGVIFLVTGVGGKDFSVGVVGAIPLVVGFIVASQKRERAIVLAATGGETTALKSRNHVFIQSIVEALNYAVVERG